MDYNITPYYDDYYATGGGLDKNYYKVLFRPGRALQARELTTAQTILQNQINSFGKYFFPEGADVYGAEKGLESHTYVKLDAGTLSTGGSFNDFSIGDVLYDLTYGIKAIVKDVCPSETGTGDLPTIWVKYISANTTVGSWTVGDTLYKNGTSVATISSNSDAIGSSEGITIGSGIVFTKNAFVVSDNESIIIKKYASTSYSKIGYAVKEEIIGAVADTNINDIDINLNDNAQGYPNYAAPGADRTKYSLYLSSVDVDITNAGYATWSPSGLTYARNTKVVYSDKVYICIQYHTSASINTPGTSGSSGTGYNYWVSIDDFVEIGRLKDSKWITGANKIGFSKQTYDAVLEVMYKREALTEGNFNVAPHSISIDDNLVSGIQLADGTTSTTNNESLLVSIGPGHSVVSGKDVENAHPERFVISKGRSDDHVKHLSNSLIDSTYGSYIKLSNIVGSFGVDANETIDFLDHSNNIVATANLKYIGVDPDPLNLKMENPEYSRAYIYNFKSVSNTEPTHVKGVSSLATANTEITYNGRASFDASGNVVTNDPTAIYAKIYGSKNKNIDFSLSSNTIKSVHKTNTASSPLVYALKTFEGTLRYITGVYYLSVSTGDDNIKFVDPNNKVDIANENYVLINNSANYINVTTDKSYTVAPWSAFPLTAICGESGSNFDVDSSNNLNISFPTSTTTDCPVKIQAKVGYTQINPDTKKYSPANITYVTAAETSLKQGYDSSSICFFEPDVDSIFAIYQSSAANTAPSLPTVSLTSVSGVFVQGEEIKEYTIVSGQKGVETGKSGVMLIPTETTNQWYFAPVGTSSTTSFFTANSSTMLVGSSSGAYGSITSSALNDAVRDITSRYTLNDGRNGMFYDWSSIKLNSGQIAPTGQLSIIYNKFVTSARTSGLFTIDSYGSFVNNSFVVNSDNTGVTMNYENLPSYVQHLDFRPLRKNLNATIASDLSNGLFTYFADHMYNSSDTILNISPFSGDTFRIDYDYFIGRTDYVVIDKEGNFKVISGIPGGSEPQQPEGSMLLWKIEVPPYTPTVASVKTSYVENKLYQQKDIAKLEERIKSLESFAKITDDELKAISKPEPSMSDLYFGLERFKNGILLDTFTGFDKSDLTDPDFRCSIDSNTQTVRAPFNARSIDVDVASDITNTHYHSVYSNESLFGREKTGVVTIDYSTTPFITQNKISTSFNVNPYNVFSFMGKMVLYPSSDSWYDTTILPDIVVQSSENAAYYELEKSVNEKLLVKISNGITHYKEGDAVRTTLGGTGIVSSVDVVNNTLTLFHHKGNFGAVLENRLNRSDDDINDAGSGIVSITTIGAAAGYGTIFGDWNFFWQGYSQALDKALTIVSPQDVPRTTQNLFMRDISTGVRQDLVLKTVNTVTDVKYVDNGIVPYIRSKEVYFDVKGMKPYTTLYSYFDGVKVDQYCYQRNNSVEPWTFNSSNGIVTDKFGKAQGKFVIPGGVFRTGERIFRLIDSDLANFNASSASVSSLADSKYTATGIKQTKQSTVLSTRVPETVTVSLSNERVSTREWVDPLAQTFLVRQSEFPAGMYLTSLDLYFANVPSDSGIPVSVEIRGVENGYPSNVIVPGSQVFKNPEEVTVATSSNSYATTAFTFDYPIYLAPGEYAFVVLSNSNEYEIYAAEMGRVDIITNELISAQPYTGSMFKSQNGSTWTAFQEADIAFNLNRAVFDTTASIVFNQNDDSLKNIPEMGYVNDSYSFDLSYTLMNFGTNAIIPGGTTLKWEYITSLKTGNRLGSETSWTEFVPYTDVKFTAPRYVRGGYKTIKLRATLTSSSDAVSPLIDLTDQRCILVENLINSPETNLRVLDPSMGEYIPSGGYAQAKHISKSVVLEDGMDAIDIKVYVKGSRRIDDTSVSNISAFVKLIAQKDNNKEFHDRFWYPLVLTSDPGYSKDESQYLTYSFELPENIWIVERAYSTTGAIDVYYTGDGRRISTLGASQVYTYTPEEMASGILGINDRIVERLSYDKNTEQLTYYYYDLVYTLDTDINAYKGSFSSFKQYATKVIMTSSNKALSPVINEVKTLALT